MTLPDMERDDTKLGGTFDPLPSETETFGIEMRGVYLRRLRRLLQLRKNHEGQLNLDGLRLLDKSIYATYCDCVSVGVGEEAQEVLRKLTVPLAQSNTP